MGWKEDEDNAYRTSDDLVGRSIRRGTRKAIKALTFGIVSGDVVKGSVSDLISDAAQELPKAIKRSQEDD